jgi:hypothetical protein
MEKGPEQNFESEEFQPFKPASVSLGWGKPARKGRKSQFESSLI